MAKKRVRKQPTKPDARLELFHAAGDLDGVELVVPGMGTPTGVVVVSKAKYDRVVRAVADLITLVLKEAPDDVTAL